MTRRIAWSVIVALAFVACRNEPPPARAPEPTAAAATSSTALLVAGAGAPGVETLSAGTTSTGLPPAPVTDAPSSEPAPADESLRATAPLDDAQILTLVGVVNGAELDQAKLARGRAKDARVKQLVEAIATDHAQAQQDRGRLATKLGVKAAQSDASNQLAAKLSGELATLKKAAAAEFDRVFVEAQIRGHQELIELFDEQLVPNAKHVDLRRLLGELRGRMQAHLEQVQALAAALAPSGASGAAPR